MRCRWPTRRLLGNAADAPRVAGHRCRDGALVANVEDVLAGETPVHECAGAQLQKDSVFRKPREGGLYSRSQIWRRKARWIPMRSTVGAHGPGDRSRVPPSSRRIGPLGENGPAGLQLTRKKGPRVPGRKERSHRAWGERLSSYSELAQNLKLVAVRHHSDRQSSGQMDEPSIRWERDEVSAWRDELVSHAERGKQVGMLDDPALGVG
jgi:hypothetical protein